MARELDGIDNPDTTSPWTIKPDILLPRRSFNRQSNPSGRSLTLQCRYSKVTMAVKIFL